MDGVMRGALAAWMLRGAVLLAILPGHVGHPCEEEVASACPDRPGSDVAACLKDKEQHDQETTISSDCTDFVALHTACEEEISNLCDDGFFTDDTIPCLTQWHSEDDRSERCSAVIKWAVPQAEDESEEGPTDELGMSDKDKQEKAEWQAKRKAARGDAIERMKMKEVDRKKEEDRVALEKYKKEDPEGYAQMVAQQEEEKRQQAEFKRQERARAAAIERKKKQEAGITDDEDEKPKGPKAAGGRGSKPKESGTKLPALLAVVGIGLVCAFGYFALTNMGKGGGGKKGARKSKRK